MLSDKDLAFIKQADIPVLDTPEHRLEYARFWEHLMTEVRPFSMQDNTSYHGFYTHTKQVGLFALDYALSMGKNPVPVLLAAAFHDCAREDDSFNTTHARRAAPIARSFLAKLPLPKGLDEQIVEAVISHTTGTQAQNYIEACLWDADRTRLSWERGYDEQFFNTKRGQTVASFSNEQQNDFLLKQEAFLNKHGLFKWNKEKEEKEDFRFFYAVSEKMPQTLFSHPSAAYAFFEDENIRLDSVSFRKEEISYPCFYMETPAHPDLIHTILKNGPLLTEDLGTRPISFKGKSGSGSIYEIAWNPLKKSLFLDLTLNGEEGVFWYPPKQMGCSPLLDDLTKELEKKVLEKSEDYRQTYHQNFIRQLNSKRALRVIYRPSNQEKAKTLFRTKQEKQHT